MFELGRECGRACGRACGRGFGLGNNVGPDLGILFQATPAADDQGSGPSILLQVVRKDILISRLSGTSHRPNFEIRVGRHSLRHETTCLYELEENDGS
jgi:hypothetical protein